MAKSNIEKYVDHPPLQILAIKPNLTHKPAQRAGEQGFYSVRYQSAFGELGGQVDPLIFEDAKRLEHDPVVMLEVKPRSEFPKGQYIKGGFYFQFDIVGVFPVPVDFGEKLSAGARASTKAVASSF